MEALNLNLNSTPDMYADEYCLVRDEYLNLSFIQEKAKAEMLCAKDENFSILTYGNLIRLTARLRTDKYINEIKDKSEAKKLKRLSKAVVNINWNDDTHKEYDMFRGKYEELACVGNKCKFLIKDDPYSIINPTSVACYIYKLAKDQIGIFVASLGYNYNGIRMTATLCNYTMMLDESI